MEQGNSRDWGAQWPRHFLARFPSSMSGKIALPPNSSCALEEASDRGFSLSLFFFFWYISAGLGASHFISPSCALEMSELRAHVREVRIIMCVSRF